MYRREDVPARRLVRGPDGHRRPRPAGSGSRREEIFGPVLVVLRADDFEHALALANDTDYALTGGVFSRSPANIRRAARESARRERVREPGHHRRASSAASRSAATGCPASVRRRAGPTTCCSSSSRAWSPRTPSARGSPAMSASASGRMPRRLPRCPIRLDLDPRRPLPDRLGRLDSVLAGGVGPCAGRRPD